MKLTFGKVKEILDTLPIGYYLGKNIEIKLNEIGDTSYFDPMNEMINISYLTIKQLFKSIDHENDEEELEEDIRCLLYHEISHVILTPKYLPMTEIVNIFEDERIETILKSYYKKVDFKRFVKKVNNYDELISTPPKSADDLYYRIVRFREGPEEFLDEVKRIIRENRNFVNAPYVHEIRNLYDKIRDYFVEHKDEFDEEIKKEVVEIAEKDSDESSDLLDDEEIKKLISKKIKIMTNEYSNKTLVKTIKEIIYRNTGRMKNGSSAINTYSGKLHPRSVQRKDYKWFTKPNSSGSLNVYDDIKINVFCDVSGSFRNSEHKINELLHTLTKLEKENKKFTFDLIEMGQNCLLGNNRIAPKNKRSVKCCEGNALTHEIYDCYKKVQDKNKTVINLVVFDGNALSFDDECDILIKKEENKSNFGAFNHPNTIIISSCSNQMYIEQYSPNSKNIFTNNYLSELESNIIKSLDLLIR